MATDELVPEQQVAFAARSGDPSRAQRDELLALASLSAGIAGAAASVLAGRALTELDLYALARASTYFRKQAENVRNGKSVASIAAMAAAREIATLRWPKLRAEDNEEIARIYDHLSEDVATLAAHPERGDLAKNLSAVFSDFSETARSEARGLVYEALDSEEVG